jgi:DNA-directed RNA polymerase subunit RPC12/RpoP
MQKYSCKTCDAELYWDSKAKALKCEYCESTFQPHEFENTTIKHQHAEKADQHDSATDQSEGLELIKYQCTECGAEIITAAGTVATTCAYCGHAITISDKLVGDFKPDSLIPFAITKAEAKAIYENYCKKAFLSPKSFKEKDNLKKMKGIYAPFWLHSFKDKAKAIVHCENKSTSRRGDDKVTTYKTYQVNMNVDGTFDKIPTDALKTLDDNLMDAIEPFNSNNLEPFNPAYMAGFYAEEKDETDKETFERAHERGVEALKNSILKEAGSYDNKKITHYQGQTIEAKSSYVMLPVWLFVTEYKNKKYTFAINGDTGKITGKLPIDYAKLAGFSGLAFVGSQLLAMLFRLLMMA